MNQEDKTMGCITIGQMAQIISRNAECHKAYKAMEQAKEEYDKAAIHYKKLYDAIPRFDEDNNTTKENDDE